MIAAGMRHIFNSNATALAVTALLAGMPIEAAAQTLPKPAPSAAQAPAATSCSAEYVANGCGSFIFADGGKYVGGFRGGFPDGHGKMIYADGSSFEGEFQNGDIVGHDGTYTEADGSVLPGKFRDAGRDISKPHAVPHFPFWRAMFGDKAMIYVAFVVAEDGHVTSARVVTPNKDYPSFDETAVDAVKAWTYLPAMVGDKPVKTFGFAQIQFASTD